MDAPVFNGQAVGDLLDFDGCIAAMRAAMASLSADAREQPLRAIVDLGEGRLFGLMPGTLSGTDDFGAKLVSVFPDPARPGRSAHRGAVVLFDGASGAVACIADAEAVTLIRTACATAAATAALARADASRLGVLGCGAQAETHIRAIARVRELDRIGIWGRDAVRAGAFAARMAQETGLDVAAVPDPAELAGDSDILCTLTAAAEPVLLGEWVRPGTHVNAVGSSYAGPVEVDGALVAKSRYFVDYRRSALAAASEYLAARDAGLIGEDHIVAEIGAVFAGTAAGRTADDEITFYKSLGHVAQDLAAARYLLAKSIKRRES
jgi:ornithine cyclodeaminase